jgi:ubiquinone/menaquinone biosynthesis C-methylase UbiE
LPPLLFPPLIQGNYKSSRFSQGRRVVDAILERIRRFSDDQYSNENRLNARIQIYEYCEKKLNWREWVFSKLDFNYVTSVLELGCGNGLLWQENIHRVPEDIHVVLTDISQGMVDSARESLKEHKDKFEFKVADACRIPFKDNAFQMIICNHMLYHVDNKEQVFSEISRVSSTEGFLYASTLSTKNWQELFNPVAEFKKDLKLDNNETIRSFNLENGKQLLSGYFADVKQYIYQNNLIIRNIEPLILYLASCYTPQQLDVLVENIADFRVYLKSIIDKTGEIKITNTNVLFKFRKRKSREKQQ